MVSNELLFYIRLKEIFGSIDNEPFAGITVILVGDLLQLSPVGEDQCLLVTKITGKILTYYGDILRSLS